MKYSHFPYYAKHDLTGKLYIYLNIIYNVLTDKDCVGLEGYMKWRKFCGLSTATTFEQLPDIIDASVRAKLKSIYRYVEAFNIT